MYYEQYFGSLNLKVGRALVWNHLVGKHSEGRSELSERPGPWWDLWKDEKVQNHHSCWFVTSILPPAGWGWRWRNEEQLNPAAEQPSSSIRSALIDLTAVASLPYIFFPVYLPSGTRAPPPDFLQTTDELSASLWCRTKTAAIFTLVQTPNVLLLDFNSSSGRKSSRFVLSVFFCFFYTNQSKRLFSWCRDPIKREEFVNMYAQMCLIS